MRLTAAFKMKILPPAKKETVTSASRFTARLGVKISVEIDGKSDTGFDEGLVRRENCTVLHFQNSEFEGNTE